MQRTETSVEERPQRAARVVPIEPSLRYRYYYLIFCIIILLIFVINLSVAFHEVLFNHSFFNLSVLFYLIVTILPNFSFKPWRILDQRRQQAARYNLTIEILARATRQRSPEAPTLPDFFTIYAQRRWIFTCIIALTFGILICLGGALAYSYGQVMLQEVQHGLSMAVVIWEISLNIAVLLACGGLVFNFLVIFPRQQIIASREGLICIRGYRTSFIPWHQARLFAIIGQASVNEQEPMLFYELASNDTVIRWPSASKLARPGVGGKVPAAVILLHNIQTRPASSVAEFPQQVQFLNLIIAERTGLQLYDLR